MKRKVTIGILSFVITVTTLSNLKAETETTGGGEDISCVEPMSNTCVVIHKPWPFPNKTLQGVLVIKSN